MNNDHDDSTHNKEQTLPDDDQAECEEEKKQTVVDSNEMSQNNVKQNDNASSNETSEKLMIEKIEKMNFTNHELRTENVEFRGKIHQQEKVCSELKLKLDRSLASIETAKRELQSMVIKYATSEKEVINCKKNYADAEKKCKDLLRDRDSMQCKIQQLNNEKKQIMTNLERKVVEAATLSNENELLKNKMEQANVRIEQLQLTVAELSLQHTEAREKLGQIENGLAHAIQIENECAQYRLNDEEEAENDDQGERKSSSIGDDVHQDGRPNWTEQYLRCIEQNRRITVELEHANSERAFCKEQIEQLEHKLSQAQQQLKDYTRKVALIDSLKTELVNKQSALDSLKDKFDQINDINRDLLGDIDSSKHKEAELLEFTERLTGKLVSLQSEHNVLSEKLKITEEQCTQLREKFTTVDTINQKTTLEYEQFKTSKKIELDQLERELQRKDVETSELRRQIDELQNDIKIVKRKNIASLKELNKEVQMLKKQVKENADQAQAKSNVQMATVECNSTLSSRTSSFNSLLDLTPNGNAGPHSQQELPTQPPTQIDKVEYISTTTTPVVVSSNTTSLSDNSTSSSSSELITSLNDIDRNVLIERILRLQRTLIKRNEKIDFLEEHNEQMIEEVKKKSKLLQYYILKEETGALATESMDNNKVYLSKRGGGIMSSLYNSSSNDDTMTLERSLEITSKLHAVLEDTLLKNMTLKENLNTLASEVDRLSKMKK